MKQLFLGQGPSAETQKGLQGNTILIAQPMMSASQLMPCLSSALDSISIVFCRTREEVSKCKVLEVSRLEYLQCLHYRKKVCEAFADITVDEECLDIPQNGVPQAFVDAAVSLPEAQGLSSTQSTPWGSGMFVSEPGKHAGAEEDSVTETSASEHETLEALEPMPEAAHDMIGIDAVQDPRPAQLFEAMQVKLQLLQKEVGKLMHKLVQDGADDVPQPEVPATEERCRRIIVDLQDVLKKLLKSKPNAVEEEIAWKAHAIPGQSPLSGLQPFDLAILLL